MHNTVALLLIALAYAFASERDYQDAERVATQVAAIRADRTSWAPEATCDRAAVLRPVAPSVAGSEAGRRPAIHSSRIQVPAWVRRMPAYQRHNG
jgi:hypothetical protein